MGSASQAPLTPEQRIKALEVQLKEANEKAKLFEAMLDVLKKDYGVKVTKKPLGKSSRSPPCQTSCRSIMIAETPQRSAIYDQKSSFH